LELSKGVTIGHLKEGLPKGFSIDFVSGLLQEAGPDSTVRVCVCMRARMRICVCACACTLACMV